MHYIKQIAKHAVSEACQLLLGTSARAAVPAVLLLPQRVQQINQGTVSIRAVSIVRPYHNADQRFLGRYLCRDCDGCRPQEAECEKPVHGRGSGRATTW